MLIRQSLAERLGPVTDIEKINLCDRIISQHKYNLNLSQQLFLEERKNSKESNILPLAQEVYRNPALFEQTEEFKNVRKYMQKIWRGGEYDNLTNDQLDFIFENGESMSPKEISLALFPDRDFITFVRTIGPLLEAAGIKDSKDDQKAETITTRYNPPKTDLQIVNLINRADFSAKFEYNALDSKKKDCIAALKRFLSAPRFVELASSLINSRHREVFETEFVKTVYNKPDLIPDEVNLYISLALEYVNLLEIREQIASLNKRLTEAVGDTEEGRKFTMSLSDALKDKTAAYDRCLDRMMKLTRSLSGDRIKKLEKQAAANASLTQFVELVKDEKERKRMMLLARAAEFKVKDRIEELDSFQDLFVEVFGIGKDEVFNL